MENSKQVGRLGSMRNDKVDFQMQIAIANLLRSVQQI